MFKNFFGKNLEVKARVADAGSKVSFAGERGILMPAALDWLTSV